MIIYKPAFKLFIRSLLRNLRDKEFGDISAIIGRKANRTLWEKCYPKEVVPRSLKIAGELSDNVHIFEEIYHRGLKCHSEAIKIIIAGFKYIDIELPENLNESNLDEVQEAFILFQIFLESQGELGIKVLEACPGLSVYDWNEKKYSPYYEALPKFAPPDQPDLVQLPNSNENLKERVENLIKDYFGQINTREYDKAFALIAKESQKILFQNGVSSLEKLYHFTLKINNIHLFDFQFHKNNILIKVFFEEERDSFYRDDLLNANAVDINGFTQALKKFKELTDKNRNPILLNKLTSIGLYDYVRFYNPDFFVENVGNIFPLKKREKFKRVCKIVVLNEIDKLRIKFIENEDMDNFEAFPALFISLHYTDTDYTNLFFTTDTIFEVKDVNGRERESIKFVE